MIDSHFFEVSGSQFALVQKTLRKKNSYINLKSIENKIKKKKKFTNFWELVSQQYLK